MAAAWGQVCRQCVNTVVEIPVQILLIAALATLLGLFVLVSPLSPTPLVPARSRAPDTCSSNYKLLTYRFFFRSSSSHYLYFSLRQSHESLYQKKRGIEPSRKMDP